MTDEKRAELAAEAYAEADEQRTLDELHSLFSDLHKDVYGTRPRFCGDWTVQDFRDAIARLPVLRLYRVAGFDRQVGALGLTSPWVEHVTATSEDEAVDEARERRYRANREHVHVYKCEVQ